MVERVVLLGMGQRLASEQLQQMVFLLQEQGERVSQVFQLLEQRQLVFQVSRQGLIRMASLQREQVSRFVVLQPFQQLAQQLLLEMR